MQVEFSTSKYFFSHGRKPRGVGAWAFCVDGSQPMWAPGAMSFSAAKAWVAAQVRAMPEYAARSVVTVDTCS